MRIVFKGTNIKITPAIEQYARKKLNAIKRPILGIDYDVEIFIELGKISEHHKKGSVFRAEIMMVLPGQIIRSSREDWDLRVAIDGAKEGLKTEIKKYKGRFDSRDKKEARFIKILKNLSSLSWTGKEKSAEEKIIKEKEEDSNEQ